MSAGVVDLVVIGGGINGVGIAADAAGRGLSVLLAEAGDLGGGTSSASSKLIHGGLRYLEHYELALVRQSLSEREVMLRKAPHLVWPLRFVLPHVPGLRPRWMIRAGLFLYDHLYPRHVIPGSSSVDLVRDRAGRALKESLTHGFAYWDCWVDDARLVIANARAAADRGALIETRTAVIAARREGTTWRVRLRGEGGEREVAARALVNVAGPWADKVDAVIARARPGGGAGALKLRLVKGSHIVVPRIAGAEDAYLMQSADKRVVFVLPFAERFSLIGTTDVPVGGDPGEAACSEAEETYLLDLVGRFFRQPITRKDIVWRFAGVRPLQDDETAGDPSRLSRDYRLELEAGEGVAPLLTVVGGKVTTYRRLAEAALEKLAPSFPRMGRAWTRDVPLPGGDIGERGFEAFVVDLQRRYPGLALDVLRPMARRQGSLAAGILGAAKTLDDLGGLAAPGLSVREVEHMRGKEWARTPADVLWRRSKAGLPVAAAERPAVEARIARLLGA